MLKAGNIDQNDLRLLHLTDSPQDAVNFIIKSQENLSEFNGDDY
jgi:hypothetical protein